MCKGKDNVIPYSVEVLNPHPLMLIYSTPAAVTEVGVDSNELHDGKNVNEQLKSEDATLALAQVRDSEHVTVLACCTDPLVN